MKIFSKEQIYEGNALTAEKNKIASVDLMENAGIQLFNWIHKRVQGAPVPIYVFCGIGNNGGDGLVVARHLINHGYNVKTYIVNHSKTRSKNFLINYERIKKASKEWPILLDASSDLPSIEKPDIIIDAVFGIGLNRGIDDWVKKVFSHIQKSKAFVLSIDIPSGLYTDKLPEDEGAVVKSNYTLSFQTPKLVFFLPQTAKYTTQWEVIDIGIDKEYLLETQTAVELIGKYEVLPIYKPRDKFSHKGNYGHALIIGGSYGMIGSVVLASRSLLAVGAGKVTAYVPKCGYNVVQTALAEAMVITDVNNEEITEIRYDISPNVIGIGVGMGGHKDTLEAFESFLKINKVPLVIDADGLNLLAKKTELLKLLQPLTVLTPHPGELHRLIGDWKDDFDKLNKTKAFAKKYNVIVVIKGANTITVFNDKFYVNSTGNPGLATAGTGDVLTGMITGLIAQGYEAIDAAVFGVYLHGKSADIIVEGLGYQSMIASHVIDGIANAYLDLFAKPEQPDSKPEENQSDKK